MKILLGTLTVWALILAPTLCFGGVVEHACSECETVSCAHEQDCVDDPCNEPVFRSDDHAFHSTLASMAALDADFFLAQSMTAPISSGLPSSRPPTPPVVYESDLPLLI